MYGDRGRPENLASSGISHSYLHCQEKSNVLFVWYSSVSSNNVDASFIIMW